MKPRFLVVLGLAAGIAGCGGGGSSPAPAGPPAAAPPLVNKSAGGIWHGFSLTSTEQLTLFVTESGELRTIGTTGAPGANPPAFGSGAVLVNGDRLEGAFDSRVMSAAASEKCTFTGTVVERVSLSLNLDCASAGGSNRTSSVALMYDADYGAGSALSTIAGNYVLGVGAATNFLNIDGNGVIFGVYDNGPSCTVNGLVKLVDTRWNLYRFEWQLSLCTRLAQFEGATLTGLAVARPRGAKAGSFLVLLTGMVAGRLEAVSVLYEPP